MSLVRQKLARLKVGYRDSGVFGFAQYIGRVLISSICDYQVQEVRGRVGKDRDAVLALAADASAINCVLLESGQSIRPFAPEFLQPFRDSVESLQKRLDHGCAVNLARSTEEGGAIQQVVGYSILEFGGLSAAGIKGKISKDILFIHYTEVAPKYRGQGIAQVLAKAIYDYAWNKGNGNTCTAHTPGNLASRRAFRKSGSGVLCYAVRISFLRGLLVWHTPWKKIERAVAALDGHQQPTSDEKSTLVPGLRSEI
jgi:GNAT superfamily N-acetyltransferase